MRLTRTSPLGDLETAVMEHCWTAGSERCAVRSPRGISLNTIQSTMKRLYAKGLLARDKVSDAHLYARECRVRASASGAGEIATHLSRSGTHFAALYRITQDDVTLTFADKTPGAEQLVRDILGLEWPPIGRAWI